MYVPAGFGSRLLDIKYCKVMRWAADFLFSARTPSASFRAGITIFFVRFLEDHGYPLCVSISQGCDMQRWHFERLGVGLSLHQWQLLQQHQSQPCSSLCPQSSSRA